MLTISGNGQRFTFGAPGALLPYPAAVAANSSRLVLPYNSYVNVPYGPELNPAANMTLEWRGTFGTNNGNAVLVEKSYTSHTAPYYQYAIIARPDNIRFDLTVGGVRISTYAAGLTELVVNGRAVISATYDGSEINLYFNGRLVGTTLITGALGIYVSDLRFSGHANVTTERVTDAGYEEVRVWDAARTQEEII